MPIADGFEEIEGIVTVDVLRRAGIEVVVAALSKELVTATRQTRHIADALLDDVLEQKFDLIVLPGGRPGADYLREHDPLIHRLKRQAQESKWIAAICAAPIALEKAGLLVGKTFTSHPSVSEEFASARCENRVCIDGTLITAQGAGVSFEFAFEIVRRLCGEASLKEVNQGLLCPESFLAVT